jgi:hypothetical protein
VLWQAARSAWGHGLPLALHRGDRRWEDQGLVSAETVDDMGEYSALISLVYGEMKFEDVGPSPAFLSELPAMVGLG